MKDDSYTRIICKKFCRFFKEGKEELHCETYQFVKRRFPPEVLENLTKDFSGSPDFSQDSLIRELICTKCDFLIDGCDFRDGLGSAPCGGYGVVEHLIKSKSCKRFD